MTPTHTRTYQIFVLVSASVFPLLFPLDSSHEPLVRALDTAAYRASARLERKIQATKRANGNTSQGRPAHRPIVRWSHIPSAAAGIASTTTVFVPRTTLNFRLDQQRLSATKLSERSQRSPGFQKVSRQSKEIQAQPILTGGSVPVRL